jgi:hypothetical protein
MSISYKKYYTKDAKGNVGMWETKCGRSQTVWVLSLCSCSKTKETKIGFKVWGTHLHKIYWMSEGI